MTLGFDPQRCGDRLSDLVRKTDMLTVIAPFITIAGIEPLLAILPSDCRLEIITRWRPDEVATGVSEPRIFDLVKQRSGTVALNPAVHAKAYITPTRALVGSANLTANGLGWQRPGAIELLVEVPANEPSLAALIKVLRTHSVPATAADRDAVLAAAALLPQAAVRIRAESTNLTDWLPDYRIPDVLWRVYSGQREESVARIVRPELAALGVPEGLATEDAFNKYVGAILRQGFTGRVARECSNLVTIKAVERLVALTVDSGHVLDDPTETWETLAAWITHFLPGYRRVWGGTRLIG